jgi:hypothetical protein
MRPPDIFDRFDDEEEREGPRVPRCNRCGSTEVRWRQQTGKWVLFALQPGKEHVCEIPDDFDVVQE